MIVFQGEKDNLHGNRRKGYQVMVDHSARAYVRMQEHQPKNKLSRLQSARLESIMARSYTDDADMRRGALSVPRNHFRPGLRDDEVRCSHLSAFPGL